MAEEVIISQAEIDAVDKEVNAKLASEAKSKNEGLAKKIREDVEIEFKRKAEIQKLQDDLKKQAEDLKKSQEEVAKAKVEADAKLKELETSFRKEVEDLTAVRRGIVDNSGSPFDRPANNNANIRVVDGKSVDVSNSKLMDEIEEQSRLATMRAWGIDPYNNPEWGRDPRKNR